MPTPRSPGHASTLHPVPAEDPIVTEATVASVVAPRVFHVDLPNGKRVIAHVPARAAPSATTIRPGDIVVLEMTPYDFDHARIRIRVAPTPGDAGEA